jgi:hypothetical protein
MYLLYDRMIVSRCETWLESPLRKTVLLVFFFFLREKRCY